MTQTHIHAVEEERNVQEGEFVEVPLTQAGVANSEDGDTNGESTPEGSYLDLQDVAYMVIIGRDKSGENIFRTVGVNDLLMVSGLLHYAQKEVDFNIDKFLYEKNKAFQEQQLQQARAQQ